MPATYFRYETDHGDLNVQLQANGWARIDAHWTTQITCVDPRTMEVRQGAPDPNPDLPTNLLLEIRHMWGR